MGTRGCAASLTTRTVLRLTPLLILAVLATLGAACGAADTAVTDMDGYWEVSNSDQVAPYWLLRFGWSEGGYLVEPSSYGGVHWSAARDEGDTLAADGTGPTGEKYVVRFEPGSEADTLTMTVTAAQEGAAPIMQASLRRPEGFDTYVEQAFRSELAEWKATTVKGGIHALQVAVQAWMADHEGMAPPLDEVWPYGALSKYVDVWPQNPCKGRVMLLGDGLGDYTYGRVGDGRGYWLKGHLPGKQTYIVP